MYCISIPKYDLDLIAEACKIADLVEIRADLMDLNYEKIFEISKLTNNIIYKDVDYFSNQEKLNNLKYFLQLGIKYIDIDFSEYNHFNEIEEILKKFSVKKIISYHNFELTKNINELKQIIDKINIYNPDYIKIATKINSEEDNHTLFSLMNQFSNLIIIGMGNLGKLTRILGIKYSPINYVSYNSELKTAEGQFTISELQLIESLING